MAEAMVMDGGRRGEIVKVCADLSCRVHHPDTPSPQVVQGLLRWASPKMMNVYDEAVALEKRTAHEKLLLNLTQRTAGEVNFVSV